MALVNGASSTRNLTRQAPTTTPSWKKSLVKDSPKPAETSGLKNAKKTTDHINGDALDKKSTSTDKKSINPESKSPSIASVIAPEISEKKSRHVLYAGDELSGDENFIRSQNGRYEAVFTSDGVIEVYLTEGKTVGDRSVIIFSRRFKSGLAIEGLIKWRLTEHGEFLALTSDGNVFFSTETRVDAQKSPIKVRLEIRDDGNVLLYHGENAVWKTTTGEHSHWSIQYLYSFGAKFRGLGLLKQGSTIYNGDFLAKLENDGRLCVYQFEHDLNGAWKCDKCIWSSTSTSKKETYIQPFRLFVQPDGDVVIKDGKNDLVWRTRTSGKVKTQPALLELTEDGKLQLKDGDDKMVWLSGDDGHPKQNFKKSVSIL